MPIEITCGGELAHQDFEVVPGHAVGVAVQGVPCTSDGIVYGDVASGKAPTSIEIGEPRIVTRLDGADVGFSGQCIGCSRQTDGDPRVISQVRVDREEKAVDAVGDSSAEGGVVEVCRGVDVGRVGRIAGHRGNEVVAVYRGGVDVCRAVAGEVSNAEGTDQQTDVFVDHFDLDAVFLGMEGGVEWGEQQQGEEG